MVQKTRPSLLDALLGGLVSLVSNANAGIVTAITGAKRVFLSRDGVSGEWGKIDGDYITSLSFDKLVDVPPTIGLEIGDPAAITVGASMVQGSGAVAAANHVHACATGEPSNIGTANSAGDSGLFVHSNHVHALSFTTVQSVLAGATGAIAVNSQRITGGADPINAQDFATKSYADAHAQGLVVVAPVDAIFSAGINALSGTSYTADDVALTAGKRVFVNQCANPSYIGLWVVESGSWTRPVDFPNAGNAKGVYFLVLGGTLYANTGWVCNASSDGLYIIGSSLLGFAQFSSVSSTAAGDGLVKVGNALNVAAADSTIVVEPDAIRVGTVQNGNLASGIDPAKIAQSWFSVSNRKPTLITASTGIAFDWNGTGNILTVRTTFAVPAGPVPSWETHYPTTVSAGSGIGFSWNSSTGDIQIVATPVNPTVQKNGTHRTHRYHQESAFPLNTTTTTIDITQATWKGDTVAPNAATWMTQATVTLRILYIDSTSYEPIDATYTARLFWQRVGGTWGISGGTVAGDHLGTITAGISLAINLIGPGDGGPTDYGLIRITVHSNTVPGNVSDAVLFVDIVGGGNYAT